MVSHLLCDASGSQEAALIRLTGMSSNTVHKYYSLYVALGIQDTIYFCWMHFAVADTSMFSLSLENQ